MSAAQHADKILAAWENREVNETRFRTEIEDALESCRASSPGSRLEQERQQLLEGVAEHFRQACSPQRLEAGFALLRHLRGCVRAAAA